MKTNFLRSTVMLVLVMIIPVIFSISKKVDEYSSNKSDWHYIVSIGSLAIVSFILIAGLLLLIYSFLFHKPTSKKTTNID